jgi:hypothetical protein
MSAADEMVLAGSGPTPKTPIDGMHSRTSMILLIDSFFVFMFAWDFIGFNAAIVPGVLCLMVWFSYRNRTPIAYWPGAIIMMIATLFFLLILFIHIYALISGNGGSILISVLIGWAAFSSIRFIRLHFHPVYRMGYLGHGIPGHDQQLHPGEMLAACPTCLAVLAINPMMLSLEDKCPHCDGPLILSEEE